MKKKKTFVVSRLIPYLTFFIVLLIDTHRSAWSPHHHHHIPLSLFPPQFLLSFEQYCLWCFDHSFNVPDAWAVVESYKKKELQLRLFFLYNLFSIKQKNYGDFQKKLRGDICAGFCVPGGTGSNLTWVWQFSHSTEITMTNIDRTEWLSVVIIFPIHTMIHNSPTYSLAGGFFRREPGDSQTEPNYS